MLGGDYAEYMTLGHPTVRPPEGWMTVPQSQRIVPVDHFRQQGFSGDHHQFPPSLTDDPRGGLAHQQISSSQPVMQQLPSYRQPNTNQYHQTLPQQWDHRHPGSQMPDDQNQGVYKESNYDYIDWSRYNDGNEGQ